MPTYGEAKTRNMIRGILPSTARNGARNDLANIKRKARRTNRQALHVLALDPEEWDGCPTDFADYPDTEIRYAMYDRRDHDNVSAFVRWAPHQVKGVRPRDALSKMRGLVPDSLVGRHALTHIDHLDEFHVPDTSDAYWRRRAHLHTKEHHAFIRACRYAALDAGLRKILETRLMHRRLNAMLKDSVPVYGNIRGTDGKYNRVQVKTLAGRPLYGAHDIEAFVAYYASGRGELTDILERALKKVTKNDQDHPDLHRQVRVGRWPVAR